MNNVITELSRMDDYEKLMKDIIEIWHLPVKISETNPGYVNSNITVIEIDLNSIGVYGNIVLRPYNDNSNAERGVKELQWTLHNQIEAYEDMSFYTYIRHKKDGVWDDMPKSYEKWQKMLYYIESNLKNIYAKEIKGE
mgnify:CR=1 FL=1